MRATVPIMAALLALCACGGDAPIPATSTPPTIRLPAVPGRPAAGYFLLPVHGDRGALVSVTSPHAGRIEMHETTTSGNMTSMRPIARIPVRDGDTLSFAPGGRHLMLYDLDPSLEPGGRITLIFNFERGDPLRLDGSLTSAGGETH